MTTGSSVADIPCTYSGCERVFGSAQGLAVHQARMGHRVAKRTIKKPVGKPGPSPAPEPPRTDPSAFSEEWKREVAAMTLIGDALARLDPGARARVLRWAEERFS